MTAQPSCHVQNFIAILLYNLDESRMKYVWNLSSDGKIVCETDPWSTSLKALKIGTFLFVDFHSLKFHFHAYKVLELCLCIKMILWDVTALILNV